MPRKPAISQSTAPAVSPPTAAERLEGALTNLKVPKDKHEHFTRLLLHHMAANPDKEFDGLPQSFLSTYGRHIKIKPNLGVHIGRAIIAISELYTPDDLPTTLKLIERGETDGTTLLEELTGRGLPAYLPDDRMVVWEDEPPESEEPPSSVKPLSGEDGGYVRSGGKLREDPLNGINGSEPFRRTREHLNAAVERCMEGIRTPRIR